MTSIDGLIKRRILINYRADPRAVSLRLPPPFDVQQVGGFAMIGVCLIRIKHVRPGPARLPVGLASENAAYRVAVEWIENGARRTGVYVARRDTSSALQRLLGGVLFPGEYGRGEFSAEEDGEGPGSRIEIHVRAADGRADVDLIAWEMADFPPTACFETLEAASRFYEAGSVGYSPREASSRLDGLRLDATGWQVRPLRVELAKTTFLPAWAGVPASALELDNVLLMRDVPHRWRPLTPLGPDTDSRKPAGAP